MHLCDYGCGREAKYLFKNGKWCCESHYSRCPASKEKTAKVTEELWKNSEVREKRIKAMKFTIKKIQKLYPIFSKEEEMRYNPDKLLKKEIQVRCKYNECKNSKENGGWFTPLYEQFRARRDALEHNDGNDGAYFYCSERCKQNCCLYRITSDPNILKEFEKYRNNVDKVTYRTCKKYFDIIENIKLRGKEYGYVLDHKFSIYDGFINNVDPEIIGHHKNLECIPWLENSKKNKNSSITLKELLNKIQQDF